MKAVLESKNILQALVHAHRRAGTIDAFRWKTRGTSFDGSMTNRRFLEHVARFAITSRDLLKTAPVTAILLENRIEFNLADYGTMAAGGISVGLYKEEKQEEQAFKIDNSKANLLLTNETYFAAYGRDLLATCPSLQRIILCGPYGMADPNPRYLEEEKVIPFSRMIAGDATIDDLMETAQSIEADSICRHVYTSGTTGSPKAAQLSHLNYLANFKGYYERLRAEELIDRLRYPSYLPHSHVIEQAGSIGTMLLGGRIFFTDKYQLKEDLPTIKPVLFIVVPKVLALVRKGISQKLPKPLFLLLSHRRSPAFVKSVLGRFVLKQLGLQCVKRCLTAGARLPDDLFLFYRDSLGIEIFNMFGMSETAGAVTSSAPGTSRPGSVGWPLPGVECRIVDDELCVKGHPIFQGYLHMEDKGFDDEGFFHTGDCARELDGHYYITGRASRIVKMANGLYVNEELVAETILENCPTIQQAAVFCEAMEEPVALVTVGDDDKIHRLLAGRLGLTYRDQAKFLREKALIDTIEREARSYSQKSKSMGPGFHVTKFLLCPPFSTTNRQMTAVQKVKHGAIKRAYHDQIDDMVNTGVKSTAFMFGDRIAPNA